MTGPAVIGRPGLGRGAEGGNSFDRFGRAL